MTSATDRVRALVDGIDPLDPTEAAHRRDVLDWIDSGAELFRTKKPATPPKHLVAYSVLVDSERGSALLVAHRDAQLWLPTGGHVDPGEPPADAARREINEELGIAPPFLSAVGALPLLVTVTETVGRSASHVDVSLWFAFAGTVHDALRPDPREFAETRWWKLDDIAHRPDTRFDPHLPRFVEKLRRTG